MPGRQGLETPATPQIFCGLLAWSHLPASGETLQPAQNADAKGEKVPLPDTRRGRKL